MSRKYICTFPLLFLSACTSASLNHALGTPKNPTAIFSNPGSFNKDGRYQQNKYKDDQKLFIVANYNILIQANSKLGDIKIPENNMRPYLSAGFNLSDIYCSEYFAKTDAAYRRRKFSRTLTNDAGTAITTILGLANAGESAVTALGAITGLADSAWRNYDDSFVISPELAVVQGLVESAQDGYRAKILNRNATIPSDYATAQSIIRRYAGFCTHLGMRRLLETSAIAEVNKLEKQTDDLTKNILKGKTSSDQPKIIDDKPATPMPTISSNSPIKK